MILLILIFIASGFNFHHLKDDLSFQSFDIFRLIGCIFVLHFDKRFVFEVVIISLLPCLCLKILLHFWILEEEVLLMFLEGIQMVLMINEWLKILIWFYYFEQFAKIEISFLGFRIVMDLVLVIFIRSKFSVLKKLYLIFLLFIRSFKNFSKF